MGGRKREEKNMRHKETATRMLNRKHISAATAATITVLTGEATLSMTYSS